MNQRIILVVILLIGVQKCISDDEIDHIYIAIFACNMQTGVSR
jgi:hypothetical protein